MRRAERDQRGAGRAASASPQWSTEVGVADVDPDAPASTVAVDPLGRVGRRTLAWPMSTLQPLRARRRRRQRRATVRSPASVATRSTGGAAEPGLEHGLGQAADAVAAHLGAGCRRR